MKLTKVEKTEKAKGLAEKLKAVQGELEAGHAGAAQMK